jgi:filamentous hemagglutinin
MGGFSKTDIARMTGSLREAARGKGDFGIGGASAREADAMGKAWVGSNSSITKDGILISKDGLRQYRPPSYKPKLGNIQANFESRQKANGKWQSNAHLDVEP